MEECKLGNLTNWAKSELERIGGQDDEMQQLMNKNILEVVEVFSNQGHSGFSASYALDIIKRLLDWKPITPITGEEDEWMEVSENMDGSTQQNKRCSAVFRENNDNSTAYYIDGKVFSDDGGETWWTGKDSFIPVVFPFVIPESPERIILENKMT